MPDMVITVMAALASVESHRRVKNQTITRSVTYIARTWRKRRNSEGGRAMIKGKWRDGRQCCNIQMVSLCGHTE
jgi:hypothetical protein